MSLEYSCEEECNLLHMMDGAEGKVGLVSFEMHPVYSWLVMADDQGHVTVVDYTSGRTLHSVSTTTLMDRVLQATSIHAVVDASAQGKGKIGAIRQVRFFDHHVLFSNVLNKNVSSTILEASPLGHRWVVIVCDYRVFLYDYVSGCVSDIPVSALDGKAQSCVEFFWDPFALFVFGGTDGVLRVFDLVKWAVTRRLSGGHHKSVTNIITVENVAKTAIMASMMDVNAFMLSPSSSSSSSTKADTPIALAVSTGADGTLCLWDVGGLAGAELKAGKKVATDVDVTYQYNTKTFITCGSDKRIMAWDHRLNCVSTSTTKDNYANVANLPHPRFAHKAVLVSLKSSATLITCQPSGEGRVTVCNVSQYPGAPKNATITGFYVHPMVPHLVAVCVNRCTTYVVELAPNHVTNVCKIGTSLVFDDSKNALRAKPLDAKLFNLVHPEAPVVMELQPFAHSERARSDIGGGGGGGSGGGRSSSGGGESGGGGSGGAGGGASGSGVHTSVHVGTDLSNGPVASATVGDRSPKGGSLQSSVGTINFGALDPNADTDAAAYGALLDSSGCGRYMSVFHPDLGRYRIIDTRSWTELARGEARSVVWASGSTQRFAVLEPIQSSAEALTGGKRRKKTRKTVSTRRRCAGYALKVLEVTDAGLHIALEKKDWNGAVPPRSLCGGLLLGVVTADDKLSFYTWNANPMDHSVPVPRSLVWHPENLFCLLIYESSFCVYSVHPEFSLLLRREKTIQSALWYNNALFVSSQHDVSILFPNAPDFGLLRVASHQPLNETPFTVKDGRMRRPLGAISLVCVYEEQLIMVDPLYRVHRIPLIRHALKFCMLASVGQMDLAMSYARRVPAQWQDRVAQFLNALSHGSEALSLPGVSDMLRLDVCTKHGLYTEAVPVAKALVDAVLVEAGAVAPEQWGVTTHRHAATSPRVIAGGGAVGGSGGLGRPRSPRCGSSGGGTSPRLGSGPRTPRSASPVPVPGTHSSVLSRQVSKGAVHAGGAAVIPSGGSASAAAVSPGSGPLSPGRHTHLGSGGGGTGTGTTSSTGAAATRDPGDASVHFVRTGNVAPEPHELADRLVALAEEAHARALQEHGSNADAESVLMVAVLGLMEQAARLDPSLRLHLVTMLASAEQWSALRQAHATFLATGDASAAAFASTLMTSVGSAQREGLSDDVTLQRAGQLSEAAVLLHAGGGGGTAELTMVMEQWNAFLASDTSFLRHQVECPTTTL